MSKKVTDDLCAKLFNLGYYAGKSNDKNFDKIKHDFKEKLSDIEQQIFDEGNLQSKIEDKDKSKDFDKQVRSLDKQLDSVQRGQKKIADRVDRLEKKQAKSDAKSKPKSKNNNTLDIIFNGSHDAIKDACKDTKDYLDQRASTKTSRQFQKNKKDICDNKNSKDKTQNDKDR